MITEDYVSFEVAKLLKEKGFDVPCFAYYYVMPHKTVIAYDKDFPKNSDLCLIYVNIEFGSLPTLQMVMKWLREVHNIFIQVDYIWSSKGFYTYTFDIHNMKRARSIFSTPYEESFNSYEDAVETAIKYCLINLIK